MDDAPLPPSSLTPSGGALQASRAPMGLVTKTHVILPEGSLLAPSGLPHPGEPAGEGRALPPAPSSSSLDTTETSERDSPIQAFLSEKPRPAIRDQGLWETWAIKFRHSGWRVIRERVEASLIRTNQSASRVASFRSCGSGATVERTTDQSRPTEFRIRGSCCHDRLCTPCANSRSFRLKLALMSAMKGKRISFITLTLAGKDDGLAEKVDRLYKHFKALRNHPLWSDRVRGGAGFLEVKWSDKVQRWHPHLHLICDADFIDQGELSDVWRGITRDSFIVDVRRVKDEDQAATYVTKYASKPLNTSFSNSPALLDEAVEALKGRRLCLAFGEWYGTPLDFDQDELLDEDELPDSAWQSYMPLELCIEQANHGDEHCRRILELSGAEAKWRAALLSPD